MRQSKLSLQYAYLVSTHGLLRLGTGQDIERIVRSGLPRRLAPAEEVLALKPELRPPR